MLSLTAQELASMRGDVAAHYGSTCTLQHGTYNATKGTTAPPYINTATGLACEVETIDPFVEPEAVAYITHTGISLDLYREVHIPVGTVVNIGDRVLLEPTATATVHGLLVYTSPVYKVVEVENPDESDGLEIVLRCELQKETRA